MNRRAFLKGLGLVAATAIASTLPQAKAEGNALDLGVMTNAMPGAWTVDLSLFEDILKEVGYRSEEARYMCYDKPVVSHWHGLGPSDPYRFVASCDHKHSVV